MVIWRKTKEEQPTKSGMYLIITRSNPLPRRRARERSSWEVNAMKISCTVSEFGKIVRGCEQSSCCCDCALYQVCENSDGKIEKFLRADLISDDVKEGNE